MQKIIKTFIVASILSLGFQTVGHSEPVSNWALSEYTKAANAGIVTHNVVSKNLKEYITREEFCELSVALYERLTNKSPIVQKENPFIDTDNPAVIRAYYYNVVSGTSANEFSPDKFVTRQEMAKMIENILKSSGVEYIADDSGRLPLFNDCDQISQWAIPAINAVTKYSIMNGSDGDFNPGGNATREQAILSTYRTYEKFSDGSQKKYNIKCTSPSENTVIKDGDMRVNCTQIAKANKYIVVIKDNDGNTIKDMIIPSSSAFVINKATLPYGENYNITMGAVISDGTEVYSAPINFSFLKSENEKEVIWANTKDEISKREPSEDEGSKKNSLTSPSDNIKETEKSENEVIVETNKDTSSSEKPDMTIGFEDEVTSVAAKAIIEEAEKYLGIPYLYGGTTPDGFDCSGYVRYVFDKFGITLKRVSRDQYASCGTEVERKDLQPGDLVFFGTDGIVGHVGIYTGKGQMIHSPTTGKSISYTSIESNYYLKTYIGAKRVLN